MPRTSRAVAVEDPPQAAPTIPVVADVSIDTATAPLTEATARVLRVDVERETACDELLDLAASGTELDADQRQLLARTLFPEADTPRRLESCIEKAVQQRAAIRALQAVVGTRATSRQRPRRWKKPGATRP